MRLLLLGGETKRRHRQMQLGDKTTAVTTLREGAAALTRAGGRAIAIALLRECVALDPLELSAHRRLAAALALGGDLSGAAAEYVRYATAELAAGNEERARLEATYALESFGDIPALRDLANTLGLPLRTVHLVRADGDDVASEASHLAPTVAPEVAAEGVASDVASGPDQARFEGPGGTAASVRPDSDPFTRGAAAWREIAQAPSTSPATPSADDPLVLEARAMALIGSRDPEAGAAAIEATRALAAGGMVQAASDLLLELVASGIAVHDAQRELIGVARAIGRGDLADERERLLGEAARLG